MNILLTIKAVLNYLYNNLINLVWTRKIKFADGTEMTTASNGGSFSLFDIKVMSQAIADKGWACISKPTFLSKNDCPTIYNDLNEKLSQCEKSVTPFIE